MQPKNPPYPDCDATLDENGVPDCYPYLAAVDDPAIPGHLDLYRCAECDEVWAYDATLNEWEADP